MRLVAFKARDARFGRPLPQEMCYDYERIGEVLHEKAPASDGRDAVRPWSGRWRGMGLVLNFLRRIEQQKIRIMVYPTKGLHIRVR